MTFVNQYIEPAIKFHSSGAFLEDNQVVVYGVGHDGEGCVLVKSKADGNLHWCLRLGRGALRGYEVVQLDLGKPLYVVSAYDGERFFLMGVDADGNLRWAREVMTLDADLHARLVVRQDRRGVYLIYSDKNEKDTQLLAQIIEVDAGGSVVREAAVGLPSFKDRGFVVQSAGTFADGLVLAGRVTPGPSVGIVLQLDLALQVLDTYAYEGLTVQDIVVRDKDAHIFSAYSGREDAVVLVNFTPAHATSLVVSNSAHQNSVLCQGEKWLYLSTHTRGSGLVYGLDVAMQPDWSYKTVVAGTVVGVTSLNALPVRGGLSFTTMEVHVLGLCNPDFDSCIARKVDAPRWQLVSNVPQRVQAESGKGNVKVENADIRVEPLEPVPLDACTELEEDTTFESGKDTALQSAHLYLQAAGSLGADSARGIHLRWLLRGALSSHLPKANYAANTANFNKPNDYVRIFRAPYVSTGQDVDLGAAPNLEQGYSWVYTNATGNVFHLNFIDRSRYDVVRGIYDPLTNPTDFLRNYGSGVLELEHKTQLSFAVTLEFAVTGGGSTVDLELLSVPFNRILAPKGVTLRQHYGTAALNGRKLFSENIRSVRFRVQNGYLTMAIFELYQDMLQQAERKNSWDYMGRYALTKDTAVAYHRLEPSPGTVHGNWLRFNDAAYVNVQNYKDKWNSTAVEEESRLRNTVDKYIDLSNDPSNPEAIEQIYYADPLADPIPGYEPEEDYDPSENQFDLSNLYVLQLAGMDYHIARMLGMGTLDLSPAIMDGSFVYMAEYETYADLGDGEGAHHVQHVYLSLPTDLSDQRLPIAVRLKEPVPGVIYGADTDAPSVLTDAEGYSLDGRTRYLSLFHEPLPEEIPGAPFFASLELFVSADRTQPVFGGIEYRKQGMPQWAKPELPYDPNWLNIDATVPATQQQETRPIVLPDPLYPLYVHRERETGWHEYGSYGINWFSRATNSPLVHAVETNIVPSNLLQPPTNLNAVLVVEESPLLLTSSDEQTELATITSTDKTFIRLTWDYNHGQELIDYHKETNGEPLSGYAELPDADELFAEELEIYFRDEVPLAIGGKIVAVDNATYDILSVVTTDEYIFASMGTDPVTGLPNESLTPSIAAGEESRFVGGVLSVDGLNHIIYSVDNTGTYPVFTVFKVDSDGNSVDASTTLTAAELSGPAAESLFTAVENMAEISNWGSGNPQALLVQVGHTTIHREEVVLGMPDGSNETHVHKFRGILENALIEEVLEDHDGDGGTADVHAGLYKLTFTGYALAQHAQAAGPGHRVEFYRGVVRIHTAADPDGPRKELTVIRTENIGTSDDLVLYVADASFVVGDASYDAILTGVQSVNYYPGYRAYLFEDAAHNLTEDHTLPATGELVRYTIFGLRSHDTDLDYYSPMSTPCLMFAQAVTEPLQPQQPSGGTYATRPDYYGKATYTFSTKYDHTPYSVQFLRASDVQILRALYTNDDGGDSNVWTVARIQEEIFAFGADEWFNSRWQNLLGFDYTYPSNPSNDGFFEEMPAGGTQLPLPNNDNFISAINAFVDDHNSYYGTSVAHVASITSLDQVVIAATASYGEVLIKNFVQQVVQNCFLPLTEIPVIYAHIKDKTYQPIPKKQKVRDENGELLATNDPDFDMAPMAKVVGPDATATPPKTEDETEFTDFNIDGASNAHYFYAVREFNEKMVASAFSPVLGPVHLVNAAPPRRPEIVKVVPVLENRVQGIDPGITLRINGYPSHQRIQSITVYRATNGLAAQSVRTMTALPVIDVETEGLEGETLWDITDNFADLGYVPFGDPLFYMVTVSRAIRYADRDGNIVEDIVPSEPSKLVLTNITENYNPEAPSISYYATAVTAAGELEQVTLVWEKEVHNGKYHLYKRGDGNNWTEIATIQDNSDTVVVALASTSLGTGTLQVVDADSNAVYHHFKVVSENYAGMQSRTENILVIHTESGWHDIATL